MFIALPSEVAAFDLSSKQQQLWRTDLQPLGVRIIVQLLLLVSELFAVSATHFAALDPRYGSVRWSIENLLQPMLKHELPGCGYWTTPICCCPNIKPPNHTRQR